MMANDTALSPLQIFSTVLIAVTTISSLIAYLLVLTILYLYYKEFKSNFYSVVISLAVCDMNFLSLWLYYLIPCTILKRDIWASAPYMAGLLGQLSFFTGCTHLSFVAVNRLVYACASGVKHPKLDKIFNAPSSVCFWIVLFWIGGAAVPIAVHGAGCEMAYDYDYMAFMYVCNDSVSPTFTSQVMLGDNLVCGFLTCFITVVHVLAWAVVYCKGHKNNSNEIRQQRKRETRLLIQFTLISASFVLYYASFWATPYWFPGSRALVVITYFGVASCAVNPWTYLAFNKLMKTKAKQLIFNALVK